MFERLIAFSIARRWLVMLAVMGMAGLGIVALRALPSADEVLRRAPLPFAGVLPDALSSLDAATLQRLEADLARVIDALGTNADAAQVPLAQI